MNDNRYWIQKNDNYELFLDYLRRTSQNLPGWLSYFAPHKNYEMHYEQLEEITPFCSFWKNIPYKELDLNEALLQRSSTPIDKLNNTWTEQDILFLLNRAISDGTRRRNSGKDFGQIIPLRNYPSGGAEYPIIPYIVFNKTIGRFTKNHSYKIHGDIGFLSENATSSDLSFKDIFAIGQFNNKLSYKMENISFAIIFAMNLKDSFIKYRTFSQQLAFIEAGHIAQNIQLITAAMNKSSICSGGVLNDQARNLTNVKDDDTFFIYGVFVG